MAHHAAQSGPIQKDDFGEHKRVGAQQDETREGAVAQAKRGNRAQGRAAREATTMSRIGHPGRMGRPEQEFCVRGHEMAIWRRGAGTPSVHCKACHYARSQRWAKEHPEARKRHDRKAGLKRRYGVTPEFVDGKPCAICGTNEFGVRRAHVDHDHVTGRVRGILCHRCNTGLGLLGANLAKALAYVEQQ